MTDQRPIFVDSHAHLEMAQFDADREQMLARAPKPESKRLSPLAAEPVQVLSTAEFSSPNSTSSFMRLLEFIPIRPSLPLMPISKRWSNWQSGQRSLPGAR